MRNVHVIKDDSGTWMHLGWGIYYMVTGPEQAA